METRFSLKYRLTMSRLMPNRLKNIRVEGWEKMLKEMLQFWRKGRETTLETSYFEYFDWSDAVENKICGGK
jgi:hypothetical protein